LWQSAQWFARGFRAGTGLWERLQWSFGDKQAQGFTYKGTTKKYPVLIGVYDPVQTPWPDVGVAALSDTGTFVHTASQVICTEIEVCLSAGEFGSNLGDANEVACMNSIIQYMNNEAPGYEHPIIDSFFYWGQASSILQLLLLMQQLPSYCRSVHARYCTVLRCPVGRCHRDLKTLTPSACGFAVWNPDSVDTLGLLAPDWRAISWSRVNLLSNGLGLKPWCGLCHSS
jgi:hypothetical protein